MPASVAGCTPTSRCCPSSTRTYIGFEGEARSVWNYESLFVPGLLQTEDYARAVIRGGFPSASRDEVERRVQVRMERQDVLRGDDPLELWGIVDEAALRRQVGGRTGHARAARGACWKRPSSRR